MTVCRTSAIMLMCGLVIIVSTSTSMPMMVTSTTLTILLTVTVSVFWILCTFPIYFRHTLTVAVARDGLPRLFNLKSIMKNTVSDFIMKLLLEYTNLITINLSMSPIQWCERFLSRLFEIESSIISSQTGSDQNLRDSSSTITMLVERDGGRSLASEEQRNSYDKWHKTTRNQPMFLNWILRAISGVFQKKCCGEEFKKYLFRHSRIVRFKRNGMNNVWNPGEFLREANDILFKKIMTLFLAWIPYRVFPCTAMEKLARDDGKVTLLK